jgi:multidrug efflux pump subunit AcrB
MNLREKLSSGFFGFWVNNYRIGIMMVILIAILGISGILSIPKESSPDIDFGIVQIGTAYVGVSPEEIDSLITTRIEKEIKSISGIDKIESSSRQGFSSIVITLKAEADTNKVVQDIKDGVSKASLPEDALEPSVREISTDSQRLFSVFLANKDKNTSKDTLMKRAKEIQTYFEGKFNIETVTIDGGDKSELEVIILGDKLEALSVSPAKIADIIKSYNQSFPIGNFTLDTKSYDVRIEGDIASYSELLRIPISLSDGSAIPLGEFATVQRKWVNESIDKMNLGEETNMPFVRLDFNKQPRKSVFETAKIVRTLLESEVKKLGPNWEIRYGLNLADTISQDYRDLATNSLQTIILVFACVFFFIGVKESLIAALSIPLAFLVSILTLNWMGLSLNFMTNFSLILSFGIAIDLTLVIIEETTKKVRM